MSTILSADAARSAERDSWIERVLGAKIPRAQAGGAARPGADWAAIRQIWQDAMAELNQQIGALQKALWATDDDDLHDIADFGLNAITSGLKTKMIGATYSLGQGDPERQRKSAANALDVIGRFRVLVDSDARVRACDENDFGVVMSLRPTLSAALDRLEAALRPQA